MDALNIPKDVAEWLRLIFGECNSRIAEKLSNNPNLPEESLDLTWIEQLSRYSSPLTLASSWVVKIEGHYLGGLRHFHSWEIADIGILLFIRRAGRIERSKVALLQSKRLYPANKRVVEEGKVDYEIGFARLADPEDLARGIAVEAEFHFTDDCEYGALAAGSDQVSAIEEYEEESKLAVFYQLYNPWTIPFVQRVPLTGYPKLDGDPVVGTRIVPAGAMHDILNGMKKGQSPKIGELKRAPGEQGPFGWRLEEFIADHFLHCREGSVFGSIGDAPIQNLFYRRSGPIAAAIAVTIEGP